MGKIFQVRVVGFKSEIIMVDVSDTQEQMNNMTVLQLKEKILERLPQDAGKDGLRLVFGDNHMEEDKTLSFYGIQHTSTILLVVRVHGGLPA